MKQYNINQIRTRLQLHFDWNYYRLRFLKRFVTSIILSATVNLTRIALLFNSESKHQSNYRSLQRFFKEHDIDYVEYMHFVLNQLPNKERFYLVIDRTNWKFVQSLINILILRIIYEKQ